MTRGEMRLLRERNTLLEAALKETQDQLDELRMAISDARKSTHQRGEINAELLYSTRHLGKFDVGQFEAVNR